MKTQAQQDIKRVLTEKPCSYTLPTSQQYTQFTVKYEAQTITPKGSRSRFTRSSGLNNIRGARSETAVYFYLKSIHPGCDITIISLEFH